MKRLLLSLLVALLPTTGWGQATVTQGGSWTQGTLPVYSSSGGSQPVVRNSGPAGGGGAGIKEFAVIAQGTGNAPFVAQGSGPFGTLGCFYDGPITAAAGFHYLCLSPNSQGGALIASGAGGAAAQIPLNFNINGTAYEFPFVVGGIVGPNVSVVNQLACWNNASGTLLKDCGSAYQLAGSSSGTMVITAPAVATGTIAFPAATDTLVGKATTDTFTNKTFDTAGSGNSLSIAGVAVTANSGTGAMLRATSPAIVTPTISSPAMTGTPTAPTAASGTNTTQVATTAFVQDSVNTGIPVGACLPYGGSTAPTNWSLAYGQAISRVTFSTLFGIYGTAFGIGDGSTTFNMPDLRGRIPAGKDNMGGVAASRLTATTMAPDGVTVGAVGGTQTAQAATTSTGANAINYGPIGGQTSGGWAGGASAMTGGDFNALTTASSSAITTNPINGNFSITVSGTSSAFNNMPPTLIMNTICRIQ